MKHMATGGNWTRHYDYMPQNNRLKSTRIGNNGNPLNFTNYKHHQNHGYLEELPHLEEIGWNFNEQVILTSRQRCTNDTIPITTYYQYDGEGQRIRKITENVSKAGNATTKKEERVYISGYETYRTFQGEDINFERESLSLLEGDHRFVMVETVKSNTGAASNPSQVAGSQLVRYQLHNHLGSANLELDGTAEANVITYEEYHPFGTTAYQAKSKAIKAAAKRYRYTGMERDEETGLAYHSARYYLPWLGRWLSTDPIGIEDGVNVYCYCQNNPIRSVDITGTETFATGPNFEKSSTSNVRIEKNEDLSYEDHMKNASQIKSDETTLYYLYLNDFIDKNSFESGVSAIIDHRKMVEGQKELAAKLSDEYQNQEVMINDGSVVKRKHVKGRKLLNRLNKVKGSINTPLGAASGGIAIALGHSDESIDNLIVMGGALNNMVSAHPAPAPSPNLTSVPNARPKPASVTLNLNARSQKSIPQKSSKTTVKIKIIRTQGVKNKPASSNTKSSKKVKPNPTISKYESSKTVEGTLRDDIAFAIFGYRYSQ